MQKIIICPFAKQLQTNTQLKSIRKLFRSIYMAMAVLVLTYHCLLKMTVARKIFCMENKHKISKKYMTSESAFVQIWHGLGLR